MNTTEKGAKTKLFGNFSDVKKKRRNPYFCSVSKIFKFPGSLSAFRGLLISPLGVRKRAPYHPTRIYIYIDIYVYRERESGTLWGANFAQKIAKHRGHACLEVGNLKFTFVKFFRATSEAKSAGELFSVPLLSLFKT